MKPYARFLVLYENRPIMQLPVPGGPEVKSLSAAVLHAEHAIPAKVFAHCNVVDQTEQMTSYASERKVHGNQKKK